jgi:hypothetical protein
VKANVIRALGNRLVGEPCREFDSELLASPGDRAVEHHGRNDDGTWQLEGDEATAVAR